MRTGGPSQAKPPWHWQAKQQHHYFVLNSPSLLITTHRNNMNSTVNPDSHVEDDTEDEEEVEDDFDDDEEEDGEAVTLGFVQKPKQRWSLLRQLFPSKAGGVPAWLDPVNLPSGMSSLCDICGEPLQFLIQVYAPISENESAFHRTLFVFMCASMSCILRDQHEQWKRRPDKASRSVKVFRCLLPCANQFYSSEPPKDNGTDKPSGPGVALCNWCGTWKGDKVCSSCKKAKYCSQKHQALHWRSGHKVDCQRQSITSQLPNSSSSNGSNPAEVFKVSSNTLWPEFEMIQEDECEFDTDVSDDNPHANSLVVSRNARDDTLNSLLSSFKGDSDRKSWASFQERIAKAPDQVLRYCRSATAKPLWPMPSGQPSRADIPNCSYCGGPSIFEFQILPQLLYYFGVKNDPNSLDWATIIVYACGASCDSSVGYKEEFPWVQLQSPSATV